MGAFCAPGQARRPVPPERSKPKWLDLKWVGGDVCWVMGPRAWRTGAGVAYPLCRGGPVVKDQGGRIVNGYRNVWFCGLHGLLWLLALLMGLAFPLQLLQLSHGIPERNAPGGRAAWRRDPARPTVFRVARLPHICGSRLWPAAPATIGRWPSVPDGAVRSGFRVATQLRDRPRVADIPPGLRWGG